MANNINKPITKAVIAAAGIGTRFLPATKNIPKEILPIIDRPIIHYLVEEAVNSGITDIILVTRSGSDILKNYFETKPDLEEFLEKTGKDDYLKMIRDISKMANVIDVKQDESLPYGNGTPLLSAKDLIDEDEAVVYMFGDDLTLSNTNEPVIKQLMNVYEKHNPAAILAVQEVPWDEIERYASIKYKEGTDYKYIADEILEKLPKEQAPSNMAQFGRFVLSHKVIEELEKTSLGKDNELWLADVLNNLAKKDVVIAQPIDGEWHTTGDPLRYLKTTLRFALERDDLKKDIVSFMKEISK